MKKTRVVCVLLCAVCTAVLFYLHFAVYGGMLLESPSIVGVWSVCWLLNAAGLSDFPLESGFHFGNGIGWRLLQLLCCVLICSLPYMLMDEPYTADIWIEIAWILAFILLYRFKKFGEPQAYTVLSVMALAAVALFVLIMHPLTALNAQQLTEQAGYTELSRFDVKDDDSVQTTFLNDDDSTAVTYTLPDDRDPMGYYGFRAYRDSEKYCVIVSAAHGQIEVQEKQGA